MKNSQRGFVIPLIIILIVLASGGYYFYTKNYISPQESEIEIQDSINSDSPASSGQNTDGNSVIVDREKLDQAVTKKYPNWQLVRDGLRNIVSSFPSFARDLRDKDGGYSNVCNSVSDFLTKEANKWMNNPDIASESKSAGITLSSYRLAEYKCKSSDDDFVVSLPYFSKDGTDLTICVDQYTSDTGNADFQSLTCSWIRS